MTRCNSTIYVHYLSQINLQSFHLKSSLVFAELHGGLKRKKIFITKKRIWVCLTSINVGQTYWKVYHYNCGMYC